MWGPAEGLATHAASLQRASKLAKRPDRCAVYDLAVRFVVSSMKFECASRACKLGQLLLWRESKLSSMKAKISQLQSPWTSRSPCQTWPRYSCIHAFPVEHCLNGAVDFSELMSGMSRLCFADSTRHHSRRRSWVQVVSLDKEKGKASCATGG